MGPGLVAGQGKGIGPLTAGYNKEQGGNLSDQELAQARNLLQREREERFALRHPYLTGIPTLGIVPTVSKRNASRSVDSAMNLNK